MSETKKRGRGQPPIEFDLKQVEALGEIGCTNKEIAAVLGCSERTIENYRRKEGFRAALERGRANANVSLRRKQLKMALDGDRVLLIWLGKQRLEQKEKIEASGNTEAPMIIKKIERIIVDPKNRDA